MYLNVHSYYSLRYGTLSPEELLQLAKEKGYEVVPLTDINNSSGVLEFAKIAKEKGMQALAQFPNVYCKVSGMVTEADWQNWKPDHFIPYLDTVTEAFGTNRLLYGSDWPVCLVAAYYTDMIGLVRNYFLSFSRDEQDAVFGGNAVRFYHL